MRIVVAYIDERALEPIRAELLASGHVPEPQLELEPAASVRVHESRVCRANWRPGHDTLSPFLDRVGRL